jgi:hypothetical protein
VTKPVKNTPLPGFPSERLKTREDVEKYLSGENGKIQCLYCGRWYLSFCRHYKTHGLTEEEYKVMFGLPRSAGCLGSGTRELYSAAAKEKYLMVEESLSAHREAYARGDIPRYRHNLPPEWETRERAERAVMRNKDEGFRKRQSVFMKEKIKSPEFKLVRTARGTWVNPALPQFENDEG